MGLVVDIDLELRNVVFSFGGYEEIVGGEDLELFPLDFIILEGCKLALADTTSPLTSSFSVI